MLYPQLTESKAQRDMVDIFGGYNHNLRIADNEFYDEKNVTSDNYPILSPRKKRGTYSTADGVTGMIAKDTLCYTDGQYFVMDEYRIDMGLTNTPKQLVSMGAYVIILPDKKYINTANISDYGSIDAVFNKLVDVPISFDLCMLNGDPVSVTYRQSSPPDSPSNMDYWIDTSAVPNVLKQYSQSSGMWMQIATTYIKISSTGLGAAFGQYDGITISGLKDATLVDVTGQTVEDEDISAIDGNFTIWEKGTDYIVITGMLSQSRQLRNAATFARQMPALDFIVESENRLWGCRYGLQGGAVVNEIYASKLGDFKNWNCFMGVSTDSYVASCGTDGAFTGAITHLGFPIFFKENCMHKVYGNFPANYQIQTTDCRGVQRGSAKSLAVVNEVLYYKSRLGVCAYDGSLPTEISESLGDVQYTDAVGGSHGNKYYISMKDSSNLYHLFVYDALRGIWHKEDNLQADGFCSCRSEMYYIDSTTKVIHSMIGGDTIDEKDIDWYVESGLIGIDYANNEYISSYIPDHKYISKLNIRMCLDEGAKVYVFLKYDDDDQWERVWSMTSKSLRSFYIPIRPRRCDHFRFKIIGEGDAKIFSITKTIEEGSDL